jgi:hypothetical protein
MRFRLKCAAVRSTAMSQAAHFTLDDHSEGVFAYADILFHWYIGTFAGERCITLSIGCEAAN